MAAYTKSRKEGGRHPAPTDIVHNGGLEGVTDYTIFRLRYAKKKNLPVRLLTDWYIQEASSACRDGRICVVGNYKDNIIRTSAVVSTQTKRRIVTGNGIYILGASNKLLLNPIAGDLQEHFVDGFPLDWKILTHKALIERDAVDNEDADSFEKIVGMSDCMPAVPGLGAFDSCEVADENKPEDGSMLKSPEILFFRNDDKINFTKSSFINESRGSGIDADAEDDKNRGVEVAPAPSFCDKDSGETDDFLYNENDSIDKRGSEPVLEAEKEDKVGSDADSKPVFAQIFNCKEYSTGISGDLANNSNLNVTMQPTEDNIACDEAKHMDDVKLGLKTISEDFKKDNLYKEANSTYATVEETVKAMPFYKNKRKRMSAINNSELLGLISVKRKARCKSVSPERLNLKSEVIDAPAMEAAVFLEEMNQISAEMKGCKEPEASGTKELGGQAEEVCLPLSTGDDSAGSASTGDFQSNAQEGDLQHTPEDSIKQNFALLNSHLKDQKNTPKSSLAGDGSDSTMKHSTGKFKRASKTKLFSPEHREKKGCDFKHLRYSLRTVDNDECDASKSVETRIKFKSLDILPGLEESVDYIEEKDPSASTIPGVGVGVCDHLAELTSTSICSGSSNDLASNSVQPSLKIYESVSVPMPDALSKKKISIDLPKDLGRRSESKDDMTLKDEAFACKELVSVEESLKVEQVEENKSDVKNDFSLASSQQMPSKPPKPVQKKRKRTICRFSRK